MADFVLTKGIGVHHRGHRGRTDEWLTPPGIIRAMGPFDLDPCSPVDRPWPTAAEHLTVWQNGLQARWSVRVWLNPPYGPQLASWLRKMAQHGDGIALIFARTETKAFHDWVWDRADALLFLRGRINFYNVKGERSDKNAGGPSVLIAYGRDNAMKLKTCGIRGKYLSLEPSP